MTRRRCSAFRWWYKSGPLKLKAERRPVGALSGWTSAAGLLSPSWLQRHFFPFPDLHIPHNRYYPWTLSQPAASLCTWIDLVIRTRGPGGAKMHKINAPSHRGLGRQTNETQPPVTLCAEPPGAHRLLVRRSARGSGSRCLERTGRLPRRPCRASMSVPILSLKSKLSCPSRRRTNRRRIKSRESSSLPWVGAG